MASNWVSITSSIIRTFALLAGPAGNIGGAGQTSSMYSRMIVLSKMAVPPWISAGTSPRGLALAKPPPVAPVPIPSGKRTSKGTPFSRSDILTFCA